MKRSFLLAALACCLLSTSLVASANANANENQVKEIKTLQQERLSALTTVVEEAQRSYEMMGDFEKLLVARRNWLSAFLDVTEQRKLRIEAIEKHLDYETKAFKTTQSAAAVGAASKAQLAEAKAKLLEFQILLLREKN